MSKILTMPKDMNEILDTKEIVDGFIIGIKNLSINVNMCIENLELLNDIKDKDIFISLNKNMHNNDLKKIKDILIELNNYNIKGVMFYDMAVLNIYKSLNLNYDLVWAMEHAVTNYMTINFYNDLGINYAYLSSDITENEIINIEKHSKSKLIVNMFGYLPMFASKRHIVKNYLNYFNLKDKSKINYIENEGNIYPIIDNNLGTVCLSCNILNGIKSYLNLDVEYIVLNSFNIDLDKFIEVIKLFKSVNKNNIEEYNKKINNSFKNIDTGFLNKETIYKVKKND